AKTAVKKIRKLIDSQGFQSFFLAIILLSGILLLLQALMGWQGVYQTLLDYLLWLILLLLLLENIVGILDCYPRPWKYFLNFGNLFSVSSLLLLLLFPTHQYAAMLRIPRAMHLLIGPLRLAIFKGLIALRSMRLSQIKAFNIFSAQLQQSSVTLKQTKARNRTLLEAIPDLILEIEQSGACLDFIEAEGFWPIQEPDTTALIGKNVYAFLPAELATQYLKAVHEVLAHQQSQILEYNFEFEGQLYSYESHVAPFGEHSALFVVRNITQRKQVEAELKQSERNNKMLISAIPDFLVRIRRDGTCVRIAQENATPRSKRAKAYVENMNIREILPKNLAIKRLHHIQKSLDADRPQIYEQKFTAQDQLRYEEVRIIPLGDDTVLNIIRDITARKQAEKSLQQANEELEQRVTQRTAELQQEKDRSEHLLLNILPAPIAEQLKISEASTAEYFEAATILFADIVGFTSFAARVEPLTLVNQLNQIFSRFDQLVDDYGLEKIKTIGDAYMVVGGLPLPRPDHADAIANLALAMQQHMAAQTDDLGNPLQLRIGINTGPVIAGVIGLKRFRYDLWGDSVNIASRMESHSEPGRIQVTAATYQALTDQFELDVRGSIPVKGRGEMTTYWLRGQREF
ncbi:MAG: adenylate/guanylate cyclase domain-containing protein, partial [Spirulinaceae cyanobacterium]